MRRERVIGAVAAVVCAPLVAAGCNAIDGLKDVPPVNESMGGDGGLPHGEGGSSGGQDSGKPHHDGGSTGSGDGSHPSHDGGHDGPTSPLDAPKEAGEAHSDAPVYTAAPRQISPLSTSRVTSQTPTLRWTLPTGVTEVTLDLCTTKACSAPTSVYLTGSPTSYKVATALVSEPHFWRVHPGADVALSSATWEFMVPSMSATGQDGGIDTSWGTTLDVNRDGCGDVAVGADVSDGEGYLSSVPGVSMYFGSETGFTTRQMPDLELQGPSGTAFGYAVASAGDINGDGFADLVVGAPAAASSSGVIYVYLGSGPGISTTPAIEMPGPDGNSGGFGTAVASAGDLNGDGYGDIVVSAPSVSDVAGKVYILYGGAGLGGDGGATSLTVGPTFLGSGNFAVLGASVASAGDVDGDGIPDLLIGAQNAAYVYKGMGLTGATIPTELDNPGGSSDSFGQTAASAGDVNGDGYADVLVGARNASAGGAAYLFLGGPDGIVNTAISIPNPGGSSALFGVSVAGAGDVNGDGYADVVIGASDADGSYGAAYLFMGSPTGLAMTPANASFATPVGDPSGGYAGSAVSGLGNVGCGRFSGIIIGAMNAYDYSGAVFYYAGGSGGLSETGGQLLPPPSDAGLAFGASVFGTTN